MPQKIVSMVKLSKKRQLFLNMAYTDLIKMSYKNKNKATNRTPEYLNGVLKS